MGESFTTGNLRCVRRLTDDTSGVTTPPRGAFASYPDADVGVCLPGGSPSSPPVPETAIIGRAGPTLPLVPGRQRHRNARVDNPPLHPLSDDYIATIGRETTFHPDFGSGIWPPEDGGPISIPYVVVPADQPGVPIDFYYRDESDPGPYPIPPNPPIEGGPDSDGDRHILIVQGKARVCYTRFTMPTTQRRRMGRRIGSDLRWTLQQPAAGRVDVGRCRQIADSTRSGALRQSCVGEIAHALRFTAPAQTQRAFVWPARHFASDLVDKRFPPMGQRFRLRADYDLSEFDPAIRSSCEPMQRYGIILADNGSAWYVSGVPDERWDNDVLHQLDRLTGADFEAVDTSGLMIDSDSGQAAILDETAYVPSVAALALNRPNKPASTPFSTIRRPLMDYAIMGKNRSCDGGRGRRRWVNVDVTVAVGVNVAVALAWRLVGVSSWTAWWVWACGYRSATAYRLRWP